MLTSESFDKEIKILRFSHITTLYIKHVCYQKIKIIYFAKTKTWAEGYNKNLLDLLRFKSWQLALISSDDVSIVWEGGEKGDIVEIERSSHTACSSIVYRLVI